MNPIQILLLLAATAITGTQPDDSAATRHDQADALIVHATTLPDPSPAIVLSVVDHDTAPTVATINAIRAARLLVLTDLRNADTTAYKSTRASVPASGPVMLQLDLTQGAFVNTGRSLDLAIQGNGFLKIKLPDSATPDGIGYTRNGNFFINNQNELVLGVGDGYRLQPPIVFPAGVTDPSISRDGIIECLKPGQTARTRVGQISLTHFPDPQSLTPLPGAIYLSTPAAGPALDSKPGEESAGTLLQGFLESSNTDLLRARLRLQFLQQWESALLSSLQLAAK